MIFFVEEFSTQLTTGSHAHISMTINISTYPNYYKYFIDIYDKSSTCLNKNESSFNVQHLNYKAHGCHIKSIDVDNMNYLMHLNIVCDFFEQIPLSERRDEIIDKVLNNEDKNNII